MSSYLRPKYGGASIFFTVGLSRRGGSLLVDEVDQLRLAVQQTLVTRPFVIDAWGGLAGQFACGLDIARR